jgi:CheY-like chemotaxis protein
MNAVVPAGRPIVILLADDDEDDIAFTTRALNESRLANDVRVVSDGVELLDYLRRRGRYADPDASPRPDLLLLDIAMPRKSGIEALSEIRSDPVLRTIPVIMLTTSPAEEDIQRSYGTGANSYITKPVTFQSLVEVMQEVQTYWFQIVKLPSDS